LRKRGARSRHPRARLRRLHAPRIRSRRRNPFELRRRLARWPRPASHAPRKGQHGENGPETPAAVWTSACPSTRRSQTPRSSLGKSPHLRRTDSLSIPPYGVDRIGVPREASVCSEPRDPAHTRDAHHQQLPFTHSKSRAPVLDRFQGDCLSTSGLRPVNPRRLLPF